MARAKDLERKMGRAADRVQPALRALMELRAAVQDGRPLSTQLMLIEEVGEELLKMESAVGVVTQTSLFA